MLTGATDADTLDVACDDGRPTPAPHPMRGTLKPTPRPGEMFGRTYHTSSSAGGRFRGMPRISEAFFWISRMVCACSSRRRSRAFSLRSCSFSTATSSRALLYAQYTTRISEGELSHSILARRSMYLQWLDYIMVRGSPLCLRLLTSMRK